MIKPDLLAFDRAALEECVVGCAVEDLDQQQPRRPAAPPVCPASTP